MHLIGRRAGARGGFTLLELMIVLVLIAIMAAMIIPEMKGTYDDALLRSSSRKLVDAFSLASSRAVSLNQLHRVRIEKSSGRYSIEARGRDPETGEYISVREIPGGAGELDKRVSVQLQASENSADPDAAPLLANAEAEEPADDIIAFYPDGTADPAEVVLRDRAGFEIALRINPITARVQVLRPDRQ